MNWKKTAVREGAVWAVLAAFGLSLLCWTQTVSAAAAQGLELCVRVLLPSLFPFFVLSAMLTASGAAQGLARLLHRPMEAVFRLPGGCAPALLLGAIGGYPVGARTVSALYQKGLCREQDALRTLRFCNNAGPAFFIGAVGGGMLGDARLGARLYAIHLAAAFLMGIFRKKRGLSNTVKHYNFLAISDDISSFPSAFLQAVTGSLAAFLNVCAFVIFFAVLMGLLRQSGVVPALCALLPGPQALWQGVISGSLEVTSGAALLAGSGLPQRAILPALSFLCGWGGLSVQCQSVCLLQDAGLPWGGYLRAKVLHGLLAAGLTLLMI